MAYFPVHSIADYFTKHDISPTRSLRVVLRKYAKRATRTRNQHLFLVHLWDSNFTILESDTPDLPPHDYKTINIVHSTPAVSSPCYPDYSGRLRTPQAFLKALLGDVYDTFIFSDKSKTSLPPMGYSMNEVRYVSLMFHYNRPDEVALLNFLDELKEKEGLSVRQVIINALEGYRQQHL